MVYLDFDAWYEDNWFQLSNQYIEDHPEEFPTEEEMIAVEDLWSYQEYIENEWEEYKSANYL